MRRILLPIVVCFSVFFFAEAAMGQVWYVKTDGSDQNDGSSWDQAFNTVQWALDMANAGDEIWVAKGTYLPTTSETDPRSATFQLKTGVALYGGFSGTEAALNERDWDVNETILSGDINGDDEGFTNNSENVYHVVTGADDATIDGFTISGGNADGTGWSDDRGGGIYNSYSSPIIKNCTISGNNAEDKGGGIYNYNSDPTIEHCTVTGNSSQYNGGGIHNDVDSDPNISHTAITDNTAENYGGGIYNTFSKSIITNCTISGNTAYYGGGLYNNQASPTVTECTISGNNAEYYGGGIYNQFCDSTTDEVTIEKCTISGNTAYYGGGVHNDRSPSVKITECDITGNNAEYYGGGIHNAQSNTTIENCTISGNTAYYGGGLYNNQASPTVTECTISENTAYSGNGIYNKNSFPTIFGCTISKNTSTGLGSGGGIYNEDSGPTITSCIISENEVGREGAGIYNKNESDPAPTISNSIISANSAGSSGGGIANSSSSPLIVNCTISDNTVNLNARGIYNYNSATTITNSIVWGNKPSDVSEIYNVSSPSATVTYSNIDQDGYEGSNGNIRQDPLLGADYHLQSGSPCINAGDPASGPPAFPAVDIDGEPRSPGKYDMGADEFYQLPGDVDGDKDVDLADAILVLKILAGITPASVNLDADVNGDGKMGIAELIFIIQTVSALR